MDQSQAAIRFDNCPFVPYAVGYVGHSLGSHLPIQGCDEDILPQPASGRPPGYCRKEEAMLIPNDVDGDILKDLEDLASDFVRHVPGRMRELTARWTAHERALGTALWSALAGQIDCDRFVLSVDSSHPRWSTVNPADYAAVQPGICDVIARAPVPGTMTCTVGLIRVTQPTTTQALLNHARLLGYLQPSRSITETFLDLNRGQQELEPIVAFCGHSEQSFITQHAYVLGTGGAMRHLGMATYDLLWPPPLRQLVLLR
jgi:hypothetical protein